jgi:hypothetical protein
MGELTPKPRWRQACAPFGRSRIVLMVLAVILIRVVVGKRELPRREAGTLA